MATPIGINFIPSAENQSMGPQRNAVEGGGSDLTQAWKLLSLSLPRVLGAQSLAPKRLLTSPGAAGIGGGVDPHAAAFQALIQAMLGGGSTAPTDLRQPPSAPASPSNPYGDFFRNEPRMPTPITNMPGSSDSGGGFSAPAPRIIPADEPGRAPGIDLGTMFRQPAPSSPSFPDYGDFSGQYGNNG